MMKTLLFLLLFSITFFSFAQEVTKDVELKNELHINMLLPIAFKSFELSYERNLNQSSSTGISAMIAKNDYFGSQYSLTPYYRKYFSQSYAKGFFLEGFSVLNSGEDYINSNGSIVEERNYNLALGVGTGVKFIAKDNFVGTINLGIARNMFDNNSNAEYIVRTGISFGYRF